MADGETLDRAKFHTMVESTAEDWAAIGRAAQAHRGEHVDRILSHLNLLKGDHGGFAVDRLEHSLQTATRAHQAGHGAAILKPYISERNFWMLENHGVFQGYYFFHHLGLDRDMREQFRGHPDFEHTAQFCHLYDQNSFDPSFVSMPLEAFVPMMRRVMDTPKRSIYRAAASE